MKRFLACVALAAICAAVASFGWNNQSEASENGSARGIPKLSASVANTAASRTWGNPTSLPDHFARHGRDFAAKSANEYAQMAADFLQRAKAEGLPTKIDPAGTLRVFDSRSGAFGAYNRDGSAKTFFKPGSNSYFERQPGRPVDLRTWK